MEQQVAASEQIRASAEHMRTINEQVAAATRDQERHRAALFRVVGNIDTMVQQVAAATIEQDKSGKSVLQDIDQILRVARENKAATEHLAAVTGELAEEAERLRGIAGEFRV